jgi:hypothetical protein
MDGCSRDRFVRKRIQIQGEKRRGGKRKKIAAVLLASAFALSVPAAALGAEHHPPKFGVHDTQCTGGSNQPNCPGGH